LLYNIENDEQWMPAQREENHGVENEEIVKDEVLGVEAEC